MSTSKRGGARPGAGRPRLETIKIPARQDLKWRMVGVPPSLWQEFCETAGLRGIEESDYGKFADLAMIDGLDRCIKNMKREAKKNGQREQTNEK